MFLAVDIGNSNTVLGLYENDNLTKSWRVGSHPARTEDELAIMLRNLMDASDVVFKDIKAVAISSTVPSRPTGVPLTIASCAHSRTAGSSNAPAMIRP